MNSIAEPSGQQRAAQSFNRFHSKTITWRRWAWRIPFLSAGKMQNTGGAVADGLSQFSNEKLAPDL